MRYELIFIGGGSATLASIAEALELGAQRIAYIEQRDGIGGTCAMDGCVPMHHMLTGANILQACRKGNEYGLNIPLQRLDFGAMMKKVETAVKEDLENPYVGNKKVTLFHGKASFVSPHEISVTVQGGGKTIISGDQIVIATGAQPTVPEIPGLKETDYWLYHHVTHTSYLPASLAIIGGGRIGTEFAQLLHRLGSQVTLIEAKDRLLSREDHDASAAVRQLLEQEGIEIHTNSEIVQTEGTEKGNKRLSFLNQNGKLQRLEVSEILVATGRKGKPQELNLEIAGVQYDHNGILINDHCQTTAEHIWAVGDVVGPYRFTHAADYQAEVAVENMLGHSKRALDYTTMPLAYYFDPPMARVGLTETQARANFQSVVVLKRGLESVSIARIERETWGFCKILIDGETDRILGAHLVSPAADDIIHIIALAMKAGVSAIEMSQLVYAYPTRAQVVQKTLEMYRSAKKEALETGTGTIKTAG